MWTSWIIDLLNCIEKDFVEDIKIFKFLHWVGNVSLVEMGSLAGKWFTIADWSNCYQM